jgi:MoaA/NifB/PqqE/SkfB family radical SAM enzyme
MSWGSGLLRLPGFVRDVWRNRSHQSVLPRLLTYTVTFRCNARCIMCDSWKMQGKDDLTLEEIEAIFRQLPRMNAVRLTGGEPFVRRDLGEIAELAREHLRPLGMHITTNGFLTDRIVEFCEGRRKKDPLQLMVSLDGMRDKHNIVRGSSIAFDAATETLRRLAPQREALKLDLVVNQTIVDREGIEQYRQLRDFLKPLGVRHQMVMAYDSSATYSLERELDLAPREIGQFSTFGAFSREDLQSLFAEVERDLQDIPWWARWVKQYYLNGIRQRLLPETAAGGWTNPACVALHAHLRIFPNGDVPTCQFNSKTIGNLRRQAFVDVWDSMRAREQRDWVRRCPGCWAECEVVPSALYTLDVLLPRKQPKTMVPATLDASETCGESALPLGAELEGRDAPATLVALGQRSSQPA